MTLRLAVVVSHPIQHFAPWHRAVADLDEIHLKVFFCCNWGVEEYYDPEFKKAFRWDTSLLDGYAHEFLPIKKRPRMLTYWTVDNPNAGDSLSKFNPNVIQLFGYAYRTNWRVATWAKKNNVPLLLYSDSALQENGSALKRVVKEILVKRFYDMVDGALSVGDNNRSYHARFGIPEARLFDGSLPIDYGRLTSSVEKSSLERHRVRSKLGIPDDAFVALFCGKLSKRKRPLDFVRAGSEAMQSNRAIWCLVVGEGNERGAIQNFLSKHPNANIICAGFVNQSAIAQYYAASDLLVVPSEFDPHPLVITEASAFGLPTVVSDRVGCIGPNDTARPGVNALVYRCGDISELARAIQRAHQDEGSYKSMSQAAKEIARSQGVTVAAEQLAVAVRQLHEIGPR
jgi:glycosyltransferase involved in cell wall biosynthesis